MFLTKKPVTTRILSTVSVYNIYHSNIHHFISIGTVLIRFVLNSSAVANYYVTCHGFSSCGRHTTTGMLTIAYWYAALVKIKLQKGQKFQKIEKNISHIYLLIHSIASNIMSIIPTASWSLKYQFFLFKYLYKKIWHYSEIVKFHLVECE